MHPSVYLFSNTHPCIWLVYQFSQQTTSFVLWRWRAALSAAHLSTTVAMPAYSKAVNGTSSQTYCLNRATGVGMAALGMSSLWASGLGFPRPPCQRISSHSDHRKRKTVPRLLCCHCRLSFLCISFTPGNIMLNLAAVLLYYSVPLPLLFISLVTLSTSPISAFFPSFSITSSSLFQPCVDEPEHCFFPFFLRKEEGLR